MTEVFAIFVLAPAALFVAAALLIRASGDPPQ